MAGSWGRDQLDVTRRRAVAALCCLSIAGCSPNAAGKQARTEASVDRQPTSKPAAAPPAKAAGCSETIRVVLDERSLLDTGDKPFPASRLLTFKTKISAAFHGAANDDCRTATVRKALAPIRRVFVQSGAGATESTFYREEGRKPEDLVFQWAFNEVNLGVPRQEDIELGLRCWADPKRPECADKGD